jgi:hypothetical protein
MLTITQAFSDPTFTVVSREERPGIFRFKLWELSTVITVEIKQSEDGRYTLDASHGIKVDRQAKPYFVRHGVDASPGEALNSFRRALSPFYNGAVREGFRPSEAWLVEDKARPNLGSSGTGDRPAA